MLCTVPGRWSVLLKGGSLGQAVQLCVKIDHQGNGKIIPIKSPQWTWASQRARHPWARLRGQTRTWKLGSQMLAPGNVCTVYRALSLWLWALWPAHPGGFPSQQQALRDSWEAGKEGAWFLVSPMRPTPQSTRFDLLHL